MKKKIYPATGFYHSNSLNNPSPILPERQAKRLAHLTLRVTEYSVLCSTQRPTNLLFFLQTSSRSKPV